MYPVMSEACRIMVVMPNEDETPIAPVVSHEPLPAERRARKRPDGKSTNDVVHSSHLGDNAALFSQILRLYTPPRSRIADVTWGKGAFWRDIPDDTYEIHATDIQMGVDCRDLPYDDGSLDALILDPPYMEGLFRTQTSEMAGTGSHSAFRERYSDSNATVASGGPKWHDAVLDLYFKAADEALRVLRNYGVFIVKCQDEVSANRQRLTHIELINEWAADFYCKDLFVVTRSNRPGIVRVKKQEHARKNHSYFLVFVKRNPDYPKRIRPTKREQEQIDSLLETREPTLVPRLEFAKK